MDLQQNARRGLGLLVDVGLLAVLRMVAITIGLLYVKVYTNHLDPQALGLFFYLATLSYLLNALLFVPFDFYLQAYCARLEGRLPRTSLARMVGGVLIAALGLILAIGGVLVVLGKLEIIDIGSLYAVAVLLFGCTSLRNLLNNRGYRRTVATALVFEAIGRVCAFLLLTMMMKPSGRMLFVSTAAALLIELVLLAGFAALCLPWTRNALTSPQSPLIATTAPVSVAAACNLVQTQAYRTIYPWADASASAAMFAVVANVGSAGMAAVGQVFSQILLPRVYQSDGAYARRYIAYAAVLTVGISMIAWLIAPTLVAFITSPRYSAHAELIVFGVLTEGANVVMTAITAKSVLKGNTRRLMRWNIAGAVTGAVGYVLALMVASSSPAAIGIALLFSQAVVLGGMAIDSHKARQ